MMELKSFREWLNGKKIIVLLMSMILLFSFFTITAIEGSDNNKSSTKDIDGIYMRELTIMPFGFEMVNFTINVTRFHWCLNFEDGDLGLHIIEDKFINKINPFNYSSAIYVRNSITESVEGTLSVENETLYQMLIVNNRNKKTNVMVIINIITASQDVGQGIVNIVLIIIIGIVIIFCIMYLYRFRILVSQEKKEYNHILEKLIELYDVDPNKVLAIIREMSKSANMEGHKLSETFSIISNNIVNQIENKNI